MSSPLKLKGFLFLIDSFMDKKESHEQDKNVWKERILSYDTLLRGNLFNYIFIDNNKQDSGLNALYNQGIPLFRKHNCKVNSTPKKKSF